MQKVHVIVFNLVFIDFIWLATRTLLHSQDLGFFAGFRALLMLILISADLMMILLIAYDRMTWTFAFKRNTKITKIVKKTAAKPKDSETKEGWPKDMKINYAKTYDELRSNHHWMSLMSTSLRTNKSVYCTIGCHLDYLLQMIRCVAYHSMIVGSQYTVAY